MSQASITVRVDENLKRNVEYLAEIIGMNMSTLITVYLKTFERTGKIPFEIQAGKYALPATREEIIEDYQNYKNGSGV